MPADMVKLKMHSEGKGSQILARWIKVNVIHSAVHSVVHSLGVMNATRT